MNQWIPRRAAFVVPTFVDGSGDVAGAIESTWDTASEQIKQVVNNVVFPVIDLILAVCFFAKLDLACLVLTLMAPMYVWNVAGL